MSDVLRRACDLLVSDVVSYNGAPHTVERIWTPVHPLAGGGQITYVVFAETPLTERLVRGEPIGEMWKRPTRVSSEHRYLLLESHYIARSVTSE